MSKKVLASILALIVMFYSAGCSTSSAALLSSGISTDQTNVDTTQLPISTPTLTLFPTPTPTPTPTLNPEEALEASLDMAPLITGLSKEICDDTVTYIVQAGNEYGLEEGEFAGIFVPNIWVEGKQVGGVSLQPDIVKVLVTEALAKIADGEEKMRIIIPLDITTLTADDKVEINDSYADIESGDINAITHFEQLLVTFSKPLELMNPYINGQMYNNSVELFCDLEVKTKEGTSVFLTKSKTAGVATENIKQSETDPIDPMENFVYAFDILSRSEIDSLPLEKEYAAGERISVHANSVLQIVVLGGADVIYTSDLLITDTGSVVFTYPQKIS